MWPKPNLMVGIVKVLSTEALGVHLAQSSVPGQFVKLTPVSGVGIIPPTFEGLWILAVAGYGHIKYSSACEGLGRQNLMTNIIYEMLQS